jgi:biotin-dependent carboxylase-like uncharacterized protein
MSGALVVVSAGLSSTLQDRGRMNFVRNGVSTAGAFDPVFSAIANKLVGNGADDAVIEVTLKGDEYEIDAPDCRIGFAGDFGITIDGQAAEPWRSYTLQAGQRFSVGIARQGLRGYLSVSGGFQIEPVLGSRSVHTRTGIGPLGGRALKTGDRLAIGPLRPMGRDRRFDASSLPPRRTTLRVVVGPQAHYFGSEDVSRFLASEFEITNRCDRMGYQLTGPALEYRKDIPLISEGIALGSLQVLDRGTTVVTLVDRQTTGGYPKIATVITPDIRELAHLAPRTKIRFAAVGIEEAQSIRRKFDAEIQGRVDDNTVEIAGGPLTTDWLLSKNLISGVSNGFD